MSACLPVCLSACLPVCLPVCLCLSVFVCVCLSVCLYCLSAFPSTFMYFPVCLPTFLAVCPCVTLSNYYSLPILISVGLCVFFIFVVLFSKIIDHCVMFVLFSLKKNRLDSMPDLIFIDILMYVNIINKAYFITCVTFLHA